MNGFATLVPAYGRDYKNKKEVLDAFNANKDFILRDMMSQWDGKPCNKESLEGEYGTVNIRYARQTKVLTINLIK